MSALRYLPSSKFLTMAFSLLLSGGLVIAAQQFTGAHGVPAQITSAQTPANGNAGDWQAALAESQVQNAASALPVPDVNAVAQLQQAAQSGNLTETVGRTLFINLSNAKSQGLGSDIPTQDQLIAAAQAQITATAPARIYTASDLTIVESNTEAQHDYANSVMRTFAVHPGASERATLIAVGTAVDNHNPATLGSLSAIGREYASLAKDLAALQVPQTLVPLHLQVINDYVKISAVYPDLQQIIADPLRGLTALQTYESLMDEEARVFTTLAQAFSKNAILFNKDEPGAAWSIFLSVPQQTS